MQRFNPTSIPSSGRHLIEASAGTGKTYALMSMLIKAIAIEGHQPDHCLLMTFTRASTRELRARVRQRLLDE
ncbi:UvrD-helicase domain-containing protein, partial [Litorivicinus sp.]|nr:UvrD-helicase domain-containing protein [Litorivicinus sp.]